MFLFSAGWFTFKHSGAATTFLTFRWMSHFDEPNKTQQIFFYATRNPHSIPVPLQVINYEQQVRFHQKKVF